MQRHLPALAAALALAPRVASATDYYVSPAGDDRNAGTSAAAPWRTFTNVNARSFAAGDCVLLQGGQTFAGGLTFDAMDRGIPAAPVTVTSYGAGRATLRPPAGDGVYAYNVAGLAVSKLARVGVTAGMRDFYGTAVPQGGAFDIGAHEYAGVVAADAGADAARDVAADVPRDTGVDAAPDAARDAGVDVAVADAADDAAITADAPAADASPSPAPPDGGCQCDAPGAAPRAPKALAALALLLGAARRRGRRPSRREEAAAVS